MSLRDPDELHLGPSLTSVSPRTLLRSSQGPPYPAWATLEECWSPVQLQLYPTCPCSPLIWTSTHGLTWPHPWPCLITVILHGGLNSWLNLDFISGDVLLRYPLVFGQWGPCPSVPGIHVDTGLPSHREQPHLFCSPTRGDTLGIMQLHPAVELNWMLWMLFTIALAHFSSRWQIIPKASQRKQNYESNDVYVIVSVITLHASFPFLDIWPPVLVANL